MTKAYLQEATSFINILKKVQIIKKPKVYCFYRQRSGLITMDKINLKAIR
jgi:hypothetical protein